MGGPAKKARANTRGTGPSASHQFLNPAEQVPALEHEQQQETPLEEVHPPAEQQQPEV